jgi:citrate lyase beta subunit
MEKAQTIKTDVILFDLEDAVAVEQKDQARSALLDALKQFDYGSRERIVRVNSIASQWGLDDLRALKAAEFDGLLLPKVETVEQINEALAVLDKAMPVWAMIETPKGVLNVEAIAAHENLCCLVMGTNDLAKDMRVSQSAQREEFQFAFGKAIMAARAFDCDVLDGVYNQLDNEQGLEQVCQQGALLGFDGKTLIHPKQLAACHHAFSPSSAAIEEAQAICAAWQANTGQGVLVVNGRLVEALHVEQAQRLMALQQGIDELGE